MKQTYTPSDKRRMIRRKFDMVEVRLRDIFNIPSNEMILDFVWDKNNGELVLTTLIDYEKEEGDY